MSTWTAGEDKHGHVDGHAERDYVKNCAAAAAETAEAEAETEAEVEAVVDDDDDEEESRDEVQRRGVSLQGWLSSRCMCTYLVWGVSRKKENEKKK